MTPYPNGPEPEKEIDLHQPPSPPLLAGLRFHPGGYEKLTQEDYDFFFRLHLGKEKASKNAAENQ